MAYRGPRPHQVVVTGGVLSNEVYRRDRIEKPMMRPLTEVEIRKKFNAINIVIM